MSRRGEARRGEATGAAIPSWKAGGPKMLKRLSMPMVGAVLGVLFLAAAVWVAGPLLGGTGSARDLPAVAIGLGAVDQTGLPASLGTTGTLGSIAPASSEPTTSSTAGSGVKGGSGPQSTGLGGPGSQRTTVTGRLRVYDPGVGGQHGVDAGKQGAGAAH